MRRMLLVGNRHFGITCFSTAWPLNIGLVGCPETSVAINLRRAHTPEERRPEIVLCSTAGSCWYVRSEIVNLVEKLFVITASRRDLLI